MTPAEKKILDCIINMDRDSEVGTEFWEMVAALRRERREAMDPAIKEKYCKAYAEVVVARKRYLSLVQGFDLETKNLGLNEWNDEVRAKVEALEVT